MINNKYSLAHLSMIEETVFNLVKIAEMAGYEYVSPRLKVVTENEEAHKLVGNASAITECQKILADSKVKVLDIELLKIEDETEVQSEFEPILEVGALIGSQFAIAQVYGTNLAACIEKFRHLCELAANYNIKIVLEMLPWSSISDIHTINDFILKVDSDDAGVLLDLLHLYRLKIKPEEINIIDKKNLHYVHLCDARGKGIKGFSGQKFIAREARYPAGRGDIPILNYLDKINCDVFSLEVPNERLHRHLGSIEYAKYILQDTKNYLILEECWRVKSKYKSVPDRLI